MVFGRFKSQDFRKLPTNVTNLASLDQLERCLVTDCTLAATQMDYVVVRRQLSAERNCHHLADKGALNLFQRSLLQILTEH